MSNSKAPRVLNLFKAVRIVHWLGGICPMAYKDPYFIRIVAALKHTRNTFWSGKDLGHPHGDALLVELIERCGELTPAPAGAVTVYPDIEKFLIELEYQLRGVVEAMTIYSMEPSSAYSCSMDLFKSLLSMHTDVVYETNCSTCMHMSQRGAEEQPGQHCYMFADAPIGRCMQHTGLCSL